MNTDQELDASEASGTAVSEKQPLNLQVDVQSKSACERHVRVSIPRDDIERYFKQQFDELVPKAEVPGFRPGKAPRQFVENKFRKQVSEQVKGALIMDSLAQISDGDYFSAISEPNLAYDKVDVPDEGPMIYEFNIEVRPEFDMPNWKGLVLNVPTATLTESDIDERLALLKEREGLLAPASGPVQLGDTITCKLTVQLDGNVITSAEEVDIEVNSSLSFNDARIKDFDKLVVGASVGDTRTTTVQISEFCENALIQGKAVELSLDILEIKRVELISDEELLTKFSVNSMGEMKDMLKDALEKRLQYEQRQTIRDQISRSLTEAAKWELPPDLLRRQFRRELNRVVMEMKSSGYSDEEIQRRENSLRQDILNRTEVLLKEHFILERIAESESVEDSPQDYDNEIERIARANRDSVRRVRARLERTGQLDVLRNMIIERKVIELIESQAQVNRTPIKSSARDSEGAVNFALGGVSSEEIPEAKYSDPQAAPIPGSMPQKKG